MYSYLTSSASSFAVKSGSYTLSTTAKGFLANFDSAFLNSISTPTKRTVSAAKTSGPTAYITTNTKFWPISYTELDATRNRSDDYTYMPSGNTEGETYQFYANRGIDGTLQKKMNYILKLTTRSGHYPKNYIGEDWLDISNVTGVDWPMRSIPAYITYDMMNNVYLYVGGQDYNGSCVVNGSPTTLSGVAPCFAMS